MSKSMQDLAAEALSLPPDERLALAHRILASVEPLRSGEIDAAWGVEIRDRIARFDTGASTTIPAAEAFSELDRRLRR